WDIEIHANPAVMPDIRRDEKALRISFHQTALQPGRSFAPHGGTSVHAVLHGKDLTSHFERGIAHASGFHRLGQRQTDRPQPVQRVLAHKLPSPHIVGSIDSNTAVPAAAWKR